MSAVAQRLGSVTAAVVVVRLAHGSDGGEYRLQALHSLDDVNLQNLRLHQ